MNKKFLVLTTVILFCLFFSLIFNNKYSENVEKRNVINNNMNLVSMMLETEEGSGKYELTTLNSWPTDVYVFNNELSKCENGGNVFWNEELKKVVMKGNISDKCYIYFDKYNLPVINGVSSSSTLNSITATINATKGTNSIIKYYFSINGGNWIESTSNSYTFNSLSSNTSYEVKVKCVDSLGKNSEIYTQNIKTTSYVNPSVTYVTTSVTSNSIKITATVKAGTNSISKYFYSVDNGKTYKNSTSNIYTFSNLSAGTYNIKVYVQDTDGKNSNVYAKTATITSPTLSSYIIGKYTGTQGDNGLYYHSSSLSNSAGDNSYRYAGANPNNYVCFGSTASTCPSDKLYRIIGVFGSQVKIIKDSSIGSMQWDSAETTVWKTASLNTYLNGTFLSSLGTYVNKIATTSWSVGSTEDAFKPASTMYNDEVKNSSTSYSAKIGLMYATDYGFATSPDSWDVDLYDYGNYAYKYDWLFLDAMQWFISGFAVNSGGSVFIKSTGYIYNYNGAFTGCSFGVRPTFYLTASTTCTGGSGTSSDPYRIG